MAESVIYIFFAKLHCFAFLTGSSVAVGVDLAAELIDRPEKPQMLQQFQVISHAEAVSFFLVIS